MNKDVIIIGAGGHGRVIADVVIAANDRVLGFLDDNPNPPPVIAGVPLLGTVSDYVNYPQAAFIIGIGNAAVRERVAEQLRGVCWYTAIHPRAVVSSAETAIGEGSVVMANAVINTGTVIGRHAIINTAAVVEHDNDLADFAHVSVGAKLAGAVRIGKSSWIGIGAVVSNNVTVCDGCTIGAGAVVVKDIVESGIYVGVPARKIK